MRDCDRLPKPTPTSEAPVRRSAAEHLINGESKPRSPFYKHLKCWLVIVTMSCQ